MHAHQKAKALGLALIIGSEIDLVDGPRLVLLATNRAGYAQLCRLITCGRRQAGKGDYRLQRSDLQAGLTDCLALLPLDRCETRDEDCAWLGEAFPGRAWLAVELLRDGWDAERLHDSERLAQAHRLPRLASGDVRMHVRGPARSAGCAQCDPTEHPVAELGHARCSNGERHLRHPDDLAVLYPAPLLAETLQVAARCRFSLDELSYEYPDDVTPVGEKPRAYLRRLTEQGMHWRWPAGCPEAVRAQIEHELGLIAELRYEPIFSPCGTSFGMHAHATFCARGAVQRPTRQFAIASGSPRSIRRA